MEGRKGRGGRVAAVGLLCNLSLAGMKLALGAWAGALSVTADAVNNLSDAMSSALAILSFKLSARPADGEHPYGHFRAEMLLSLLVGAFILMMGGRLLYQSMEILLSPRPVRVSVWTLAGLSLSAAVKMALFFYYRRAEKRLQSGILRAAAADSLSDAVSTMAVLTGLVLFLMFSWRLDGALGALVSLIVMKNGLGVVRENVSELLGRGDGGGRRGEILEFLKAQPGVIDAHDLMLHDYGGGQRYASCDIEADALMTVEQAHALADGVERAAQARYGLRLSVHIDPVRAGDKRLEAAGRDVLSALKEVDERLQYHDLRAEEENGGVTLYFDLLIPRGMADGDMAAERTAKTLEQMGKRYRAVIRPERIF